LDGGVYISIYIFEMRGDWGPEVSQLLYNKQTRAWQQMMPCYIFSVRPPLFFPNVGTFVQLRLLRGDKNDLPTCTFGQELLADFDSDSGEPLNSAEKMSDSPGQLVAHGKYLDRFDFSC